MDARAPFPVSSTQGAFIEAPWREGDLSGTLAAPSGAIRNIGVLIIAGSGPTDRDGNGPLISTDLHRLMAHGLAAAGHTSLRYDKRGIGESRAKEMREEDLRFSQSVADAAMAIRALAARPGLEGVVALGHSEGALIATLAAARAPVRGLVLLAGPGRTMAAVMRDQFRAAGLPEPLLGTALAIIDALEAGRTVADVPPELAAAFRPSVQPYVISQVAIDPAAALKALTVPVLLVSGGRDLQVGPDDLDALKQARPDARVAVLPEANHIFKRAPEDRAGNIALYGRREAPLDPDLMPAILGFLATLA